MSTVAAGRPGLATSERTRRWGVSTVTLLLFAGAILLPQGIGVRSPAGLPNVDLPRLSAIGVIVLLVLRLLTTGRVRLGQAPRTLVLLAFVACWQLVAALASDSPAASAMWALGNALTIWLFAFAAISLIGGDATRPRVVRMITILALILSAWSVFELVTQQKVFPSRNLWSGEGTKFSTSMRRLIPGSTIMLPFMSLGPFALNLTLAGALCAVGGFLLRRESGRRPRRWRIALFVLAVLATQSRAGIIAMAVMLMINSGGASRFRERWRLMVMTGGVIAIALFFGGERVWLAVQTAFRDAGSGESSAGSFSTRFANLQSIIEGVGTWGLVGYGPGSIFDADRVVTSVKVIGDPGSYFAFFLESGLPAGLAITVIMFVSVREGLRSKLPETRAAAVGLIGFWITTLSSITPWSWGMALALAGFVEGWTRAERRQSQLHA